MLIRRAFADLACVQAILDLDANQVLFLVEDGSLLHVFNIASGTSQRRCLRILSQSLMDYAEHRPPSKLSTPALLESIFSPALTLDVASVARMLSASPELVHDLVKERSLRLAPGQKSRRGSGGSPILDRQSLLKFLVSREAF